MNSLLSALTSETLTFLYKEARRDKNQKKLSFIINTLINIAMQRIQVYMYAIMAILIILFLMNCFQFFYYIKLAKQAGFRPRTTVEM